MPKMKEPKLMSNLSIKHCLLLGVLTLLSACGSAPVREADGGGEAAPGAGSAAKKGAPIKIDDAAKIKYQKAIVALKRGNDAEALQLFKAFSQEYPNYAGAFINMGLLQIKKRDYKKANEMLLQATTLKPDDAIAQNHLGFTYRKLGEFAKAEQAYAAAVRADAQYADAHYNIGILYDVYLGKLAEALQHYETYQQLTHNKNQTVSKWIVDLKRRVGQK